MANQGSGLGKGPDGDVMQDQTSFNARNGAAKKPQTNFPVHPGMTDQQRAMAGVSPADAGSGKDAAAPNPLDPSDRGKSVQRDVKASWDMKGADGKGLDSNIGGKVLGEAILSGSAKLPTDESYSTGSPKR